MRFANFAIRSSPQMQQHSTPHHSPTIKRKLGENIYLSLKLKKKYVLDNLFKHHMLKKKKRLQ